MIHIFKKGINDNTLLLLHGTGGDEHDLLDVGNIIDPNANILSVRGNVKEAEMNRFFRRLSPGVFDLEDLDVRTRELYDFINEASRKYGFNCKKVIAIGYSNGANIAASMLFTIENALLGAILLRPMVPRKDKELVTNSNTSIFIAAGLYDNICPPEETNELVSYLKVKNKEVRLEWIKANHRLTYDELLLIKEWYNERFI